MSEELTLGQLGELIVRVRARDRAAFAIVYEATVAKVHALALRMLRNRTDAEDLVCDVYEQAWRQAERFDAQRGNAMAWLLMMCRSRCLDLLRQRKLRLEHASTEPSECEEEAVDAPDELLGQLQSGTAIHAALSQLAPIRRQVILLAFFRGMSHADMAAVLGLPLGTIKSHVRRALQDLQAALGAEGEHHV